MKDKIVVSSGNVFEDLGFDPAKAQLMALRAQVLVMIAKQIKEQGMTQKVAAKIFDVPQSRVSDLVRGKTEKFSLDTLVEYSAKIGHPLRLIEDVPYRRKSAVRGIASGRCDEIAL